MHHSRHRGSEVPGDTANGTNRPFPHQPAVALRRRATHGHQVPRPEWTLTCPVQLRGMAFLIQTLFSLTEYHEPVTGGAVGLVMEAESTLVMVQDKTELLPRLTLIQPQRPRAPHLIPHQLGAFSSSVKWAQRWVITWLP